MLNATFSVIFKHRVLEEKNVLVLKIFFFPGYKGFSKDLLIRISKSFHFFAIEVVVERTVFSNLPKSLIFPKTFFYKMGRVLVNQKTINIFSDF